MKYIRIITVEPSVADLVASNGGYCPCSTVKDEDTLCMCKEFREQEEGLCHCGRYEKVVCDDG